MPEGVSHRLYEIGHLSYKRIKEQQLLQTSEGKSIAGEGAVHGRRCLQCLEKSQEAKVAGVR